MIDEEQRLPAAEATMLVDAEVRRRIKADAWAKENALPKPIGDTLDSALKRLTSLHKAAQDTDSAAKQRVDTGPITELINAADIPKRHLKRPCLSGDVWIQKFETLKQLLGTGFICALCGPQGTGKTQMAAETIKANAATLHSSRFASAMDFFIALKQSYDPEEKTSESGILTRFSKPRLLILDEMDERAETDWENRLLFHLINRRYNELKDTVLISRRSRAEFEGSLGKSIASRIQETGGFIIADWPSYRG